MKNKIKLILKRIEKQYKNCWNKNLILWKIYKIDVSFAGMIRMIRKKEKTQISKIRDGRRESRWLSH